MLNRDQPDVLRMAGDRAGRSYLFSTREPVEVGAWIGPDGEILARLDARSNPAVWATSGDMRLLGRHNRANMLAACLAAVLAGSDPVHLAPALRTFDGLPHRLQPVAERDGVLWVDDSKATNVSAAVAAITSFDRPLVLLLGGRHKGQPYEAVANAARDRARAVIAFGEAAPLIVAELRETVETIVTEAGLEAAVRTAAKLAEPGDVVLLAPACSSFDMFPDYAARGRAFATAVENLAEGAGAS